MARLNASPSPGAPGGRARPPGAADADPPVGALTPEVRRLAMVVIVGATMSFLDSTIVNVALDSLSRQLHVPIATIQWVVTAYLLALAAAIPVTGWLAQRFGAGRMFVFAVALFTAGSVLCGLAPTAGALIAFRVLQGFGGGMIMPIGQIVLARAAGPRNMPRVMALVGIPIVLAPVFGPTLGGTLLDTAGWRWIFFVNLPIGLLGLVLGIRRLPRGSGGTARPLDLVGLPLVAAGTTALTYGLSQVGGHAMTDLLHVVLPVAGGALLLGAFVARSLSVGHPLLEIRLYRIGTFRAACFATFCLGVVLYGGVILMPLYYQIVRHESAIATGLLLAPGGIGAAIANRASGPLTERLGGGRTALIGGTITVLSTVPFAFLTAATSYWLLGVAMTARGIGMGLMIMPATTAAYRVLEPSQISDATPQLSILQRVGGSIGVAILTVVLGHYLTAARDPAAMAGAFATSFRWVALISVLTIAPMILLAVAESRDRRAGSTHPPHPAGSSR